MQTIFIQFVFLILYILALVMLANRIKIAYPIVLVLGGVVLSFVSWFSHITIDPNLVFFIFLPPLLYEAAWQVSWKEFWKFRRVITSFAFPIVILTSCVVAFASNALIPGFTLALGFLLGGIVSPPDAVSATTIMRQVDVPKSLLSIIEGESLLNDASSLIVFRFAMAAVVTGQFYFGAAASSFFLVIVLGVVIGLVVAALFYAIHRWLPTTTSIEIVLSLVAPYCMYYAAEHLHYSGVLAVVSGGLFLSSQRQSMLNYRSRIEAVDVWTNLVFVMNGLIFLLIGLQLPTIVSQLGDTSLTEAIGYGLLVSLVLIVCRLLCMLGASLFTRFISRYITVAQANPGWKAPLIGGWAGMRGVVSLAAALSIPVIADNGAPFPFRNLILFITFVVILVTLVVQGLTLPWLIRKVQLADEVPSTRSPKEYELIIQEKLAAAALAFLQQQQSPALLGNPHYRNLLDRINLDFTLAERKLHDGAEEIDMQVFRQTYLELLERQRAVLKELNREDGFDEEQIRKYTSLIDIEEWKVRERLPED